MAITEGVVYCDGCGTEIVGVPVVREGLTYCCSLCSEGKECDCGVEEDERSEASSPAV